jgi:hypothetical protein
MGYGATAVARKWGSDAAALTFPEAVSSTPSNFNRVIEYPKSSVA